MSDDAWSALVAVYQSVLHDVVSALEDEAGLDSGVFSALAYLARAETPGKMPLADLQRSLHPRYSQPGVSRLVQRMEQEGLVTRKPDPEDGRAAIVALTPAGRARYRRASDVYGAAVRAHVSRHLSGAEARDLTRLLELVAARR
jgi:DNA-binding MarR family transcriptional regulator